jgi:lactoylglutathione lyase
MKTEGEVLVELIQNPTDKVGMYSLGMEVDDPNSVVEGLKAKGAKITMEPVGITVGFLAFCEDHNGVKIALIQHT